MLGFFLSNSFPRILDGNTEHPLLFIKSRITVATSDVRENFYPTNDTPMYVSLFCDNFYTFTAMYDGLVYMFSKTGLCNRKYKKLRLQVSEQHPLIAAKMKMTALI